MIVELLICPASDPTGTPIETWTDTDILDLRLEISLNDLGKNTVKIPRGTWEGSALDADQTYYVRVNVPYIDNDDPFWSFWLLAGDFVLADDDERGGEDVTIGGPGPAWILTRAVLNFEQNTVHAGVSVQDGTWYWINKNYGQILNDLMGEDAAADAPALGGMEGVGWSNTNDVDGNPWEDFPGIFSQEVGTNYLSVIRELQRAGNLDVWVSPRLNLRAHVSYGRDLTGTSYGAGVVRFIGSGVSPSENHNIIDNLTRHKDGGKAFTHVLGLGNERREQGGSVIEGSHIHRWATDPDWSPGDAVSQGFLSYPTSNTDILERAGLRLIRRSKDRAGRMLECEIMPGQDEANGLYLPGAPGTDKGDFWIGDLTTWKTGAGDDFDLNDRDLAIAKIRMQLDVAADDTNAQSKERSWKVWIETGDDVSPSESASSSVNNEQGGHCKCPIHPDPGDPGEPPTAPTELIRWSFTDLGGSAANNLREDGGSTYPFNNVNWDGNGAPSAWHDDYGSAHITWSASGGNVSPGFPVTAGVIYTFDVDASQRQADSAVWIQARWYGASGHIQTDYIAGPGIAVGVKTHYQRAITAPTGATNCRIFVDAATGEFGAADNFVVSFGGSGGTPPTPGTDPVTTIGGTGEGVYSNSDRYVPVGSVLEHSYIDEGGPYHDADQIAIDDAGANFSGTDVEAALAELAAAGVGAHAHDPPTPGVHKILVKRTTDFTASNSNDSAPDYDTVIEDTMSDSWWTAGDPDRLVVTADYDGLDAIFTAKVGVATSSADYLELKMYRFPASFGEPRPIAATDDEDYLIGVEQHPSATGNHFIQLVSDPVTVATGDVIIVAWRANVAMDYIEYNGRVAGTLGAYIVGGNPGPEGTPGDDGADGQGVPTGGTAGQVLTKNSGTDFDTSWQTPSASGAAGRPLMAYDPADAHWYVVVDGDGTAVMVED